MQTAGIVGRHPPLLMFRPALLSCHKNPGQEAMSMKKRGAALLLALVVMLGFIPPTHAAAVPRQKLAAITFDDGPGPYTDGLLDELAKRGVVVTFFMQGRNAERYSAVVKKAYEAGHQIASHTYDHPMLTGLSDTAIQNQLTATANVLNRATGGNNSYMVRPPYGSTDTRVLSALHAPAILWSVDTRDWESRNADAVCRRIVNDTKDGSIVLLHDIHATTIPGALRGIDALLDQGYELVTVSELLRRRGFDAIPGVKYYRIPGSTTLPEISQPSILPADTAGGRFITLSADAGTTIYYTIDGTTPTSHSAVYTRPFPLDEAATVKAFAAHILNGGRSRVSTLTLDVSRAKAPVITVDGCQAVISASGEVHYTLDGTAPTAYSERYTAPVPLPAGVMVRAIATRPGYRDSQTVSLLRSHRGNLFSDVPPTEWYYHDVDEVVSQKLMTTEGHAFFPERAATRREVAVTLYHLAGTPNTFGICSIPDVTDADPAYAAILWAVDQHILTGFSDGAIRPDASVTREQLATMLFRMQGAVPVGGSSQMRLNSFEDCGSIQDYAWNAMGWAVSKGVLQGVSDTKLGPGVTVTRAQLASIALRIQAL